MPYVIRVSKCDNGNIGEFEEEIYDNLTFTPEMIKNFALSINQSIRDNISETTVIISGRPGETCQSFKNNLIEGLKTFYINEGIENFFVESYWLEREVNKQLYEGTKENVIKVFVSHQIQFLSEFLPFVFKALDKNLGWLDEELLEEAINNKSDAFLQKIIDQLYESFETNYQKKIVLFISPFNMQNLINKITNIPFPNLYLIEVFWTESYSTKNEISQVYQNEINDIFDNFDSIPNLQMMNGVIQKIKNYEFESENKKQQALKELQIEVLGLIQRKYKEIDENNRKGGR